MTPSLGRCIAIGILAAVAVACSASGDAKPERLCTPGAYIFCRCADRNEGTKLCKPDAMSFDACLPCDASGSSGVGSGGTDGVGSHGADKTPDDSNNNNMQNTPPADVNGGPTTPQSLDSGQPTQPVEDATAPVPPVENPAPMQPATPSNATPPAAHCKPLKNLGPKVEVQQIADDIPTARGGKLTDGVYVQTFAISYTGVDGNQGAIKTTLSGETLEITGDVGRFAFADDSASERTGGFRLTATGASVTIAYECPASAPATVTYDADDDDLVIYDKDANVARFFTLQKGEQK